MQICIPISQLLYMGFMVLFIVSFRTGYAHPAPAQFEDLGRPEDVLNGGGDAMDGNGSTLKRGILGGGGNTAKKVCARDGLARHDLFISRTLSPVREAKEYAK